MAKTYHDRHVAALIARGWRIDAAARPGRYTVMVQGPCARGVNERDTMLDPTTKMFVGKSGAVRYGQTVTGSHSMSDATKHRLLTTESEKVA